MEEAILIILAAGKASRFGGYPKAFCEIGGKYVVQHTIDKAVNFYPRIYLVLNRDIYEKYYEKVIGCKVIGIDTGLGEAHSLLRAIKKINEMENAVGYLTLCWGDTVFYDEGIFNKTRELTGKFKDNAGFVICSRDEKPYAYFETVGEVIVKSYFSSCDGIVDQGIHDQSVFVFDSKKIIVQLERYKSFLGITEDMEYTDQIEMKLLNAFTFFYENNMKPMQYCMIEAGKTKSFNTAEELDNIKEHWNKEVK